MIARREDRAWQRIWRKVWKQAPTPSSLPRTAIMPYVGNFAKYPFGLFFHSRDSRIDRVLSWGGNPLKDKMKCQSDARWSSVWLV